MELQAISKRFGDAVVLENFSLTLADGRVCLFGPSGCGKTTLMRILAGLERADGGKVTGMTNKKIAYMFQEDRLLPWATALENVALVSDEKRAAKWLADLGLEDAMDKKPRELSGGMQRRVALARALAYEGDVLLLDEPFKGLDEELKSKAMALVKERFRGGLMILVTHDAKEAEVLAERIYYLAGPPLAVVKP